MDRKKQKIIFGGLISLGICLIFGLLLFLNALNVWQTNLSDLLYSFNTRPVNRNIVLVTVDDYTLDPINGLGDYREWQRDVYAQVLNNINQYKPSVIGLDVLFRAPKDSVSDQMFIEALSKTQKPVVTFQQQIRDANGDSITDAVFPFNEMLQIPQLEIGFGVATDNNEIFRNYSSVSHDTNLNKDFFSLGVSIASAYSKLSNLSVNLPKNSFKFPYYSNPEINSDSNKSYPFVSFLEVYNDEYTSFDPQYFKDKIVLIGAYSRSFKDSFFTPLSKTYKMYGVEIHANAIQAILENKFLREMSFAEKLLLIVALAMLSTFLFLYTKVRWSILYLVAVPVVYSLLAPWAFNNLNLIFDMVHPYLVVVMSFAVVYIYRYITEFKEKLALKGAFSKYVNPELVKQITEHPENLHLGGEKRAVTVLFTDIAHFTTISEGLTPESLVALLNEYFDAMSEVILAQGGTLDKFEGDAIMAFFGAPIAYNDHALRAARAAVGMRFKLNELLQKWKNDPPLPGGEKKPAIDFRCGLSSGDVIVGNVGSKERFEYTVMGDIVNLGSRLEGANKKYSTNIMISEATYELIKNSFECRELDIIRVVGKTKPIRVYEVLSTKGQLPAEAMSLLQSYNEGMSLYHARKYAEGLEKFKQLLQKFPQDGPSKVYLQRCEVLRDFPKPADWDEVFEMGSK